MAAMNTSKPIQIFKAGKHVAASGASLSFSESDLAATAAAYDPKKHEAPLVIGHPKSDNPAYGWVGSVAFAQGALDVEPIQVNADFAEMVKNGAFKKISASFYAPDSPSNPVPGIYYLRHVGFLGAQPPAVKGLRPAEFSDAEKGVIDFADYDDVVNASLLRGLRDWIISKFGLDDGDKALPSYAISQLEQAAQQEDDDQATIAAPQFSEKPQPLGDEMSAEEKAQLATALAENAKLKKDAADFAEAQAKAKKATLHIEHVAFAEGLVKAGKLLPAVKEQTVALMDNLAAQAEAVEFSEGDVKKSSTPLAIYQAQLTAMPKVVEFSEVAGDKGAIDDGEPDASALAVAAVEFMEAEAKAGRPINSAQAVQRIKEKAAKA